MSSLPSSKPIAYACPGASWPRPLEPLVIQVSHDGLSHRLASSDRRCWLAYSHPLVALADSAAARQAIDPLGWLAEWQMAAQTVLTLKQSHPERCRLVNLPLLDAAAWASLASEVGLPEPRGQELAQGHQIQDLSALDPRLLIAIQHQSQLLDAYADLESWADLFDREPQFSLPLPPWQSTTFANHCLTSWQRDQAEAAKEAHNLKQGRAQARADAERSLLQLHQVEEEKDALRQELENLGQARDEASEEAELTLLQLHQVQEELEAFFLENRRLSDQLQQAEARDAAHTQEIEGLRQELENLGQARDEASEEAELTLLQLHQVQEELEHYFLLSRGQASQLDHYDGLQQRSQELLSQLALQLP